MPQKACDLQDIVLYATLHMKQEVHKRDRPASLCRYGCAGQEAAERNECSVEMLCAKFCCVIQKPSQSV